MKRSGFELLSASAMRTKYGLTAENRPTISLAPEAVPDGLRHLIPYAEIWGVGDDLIRDDMLSRAPRATIDELKRVVRTHEDLLEQWLAGPAAQGPTFSKEYLAFTNMLMAADMA